MPRTHVVTQGECLASIAHRYGFRSWRTVYDDGANASLRELRPDPFVLLPGDAVVIPDKQPRSVDRATAQRHRFRVAGDPVVLRLKLKGGDGEPLAGKTYELVVASDVYPGTTGGDGLLEHEIPGHVRSATLRIWLHGEAPDHDPTVLPLNIGHLDPVDEASGARSRLRNLGFHHAESDDPEADPLRDAITAFQAWCGLQTTGEFDDATRARLDHEAHRA